MKMTQLRGSKLAIGILALALAPVVLLAGGEADWHFNGTVIEACSCPMFCQCYFNTEPANHAGHEMHGGHSAEHGPDHFCKFNMAYKVNEGHHGETDLAGVKFWVAGDLGDDWSDGTTEWAVVTFAPGTTDAQKAGVATALTHIFPVAWASFEVAEDAEISWEASDERAEAKLAGGENAHIILNEWRGIGEGEAMLTNVGYFGSPRNSGFKMMPNEVQTWKVGEKAFEFNGTTGFMITVDMSSGDLAE